RHAIQRQGADNRFSGIPPGSCKARNGASKAGSHCRSRGATGRPHRIQIFVSADSRPRSRYPWSAPAVRMAHHEKVRRWSSWNIERFYYLINLVRHAYSLHASGMRTRQVVRTGGSVRCALALLIAMFGAGLVPARAEINKWTSLGPFGGPIK